MQNVAAADALHHAAIVAEPAHAVAVVAVGPLAVGGARVAPVLGAGIVLIRRLGRVRDPAAREGKEDEQGKQQTAHHWPHSYQPDRSESARDVHLLCHRRRRAVGRCVATTRTSATGRAASPSRACSVRTPALLSRGRTVTVLPAGSDCVAGAASPSGASCPSAA